MLGGGVSGEEKVPNEEHEVHEGPELDRLAVAGALRIFAVPEAEVESNGNQVGDVVGSWVRGDSRCGNDGVHDPQGVGLLSFNGGFLETEDLQFLCEVRVDPGVCLRFG